MHVYQMKVKRIYLLLIFKQRLQNYKLLLRVKLYIKLDLLLIIYYINT